MSPDQNERQLLDRCRCGDQDAFAQLYDAYRSQAYGTALLITRNRALAADALQECFIRVFLALPRFHADQPFRPWFFRILTNEALRLVRRSRLWLPLAELFGREPTSPLPTPEFAALDRERAEELWQAVSTLSEAARATVVLRYYAGLTEEELSRALGVAPGTVKSRLYRAREQLRSTLPSRWNEEEQYV
jgi:RNA polymerase sigma-70 factor (ECF subfamily)